MPEVLGNPPSPRAVLFWNGTAWQWALVGPGGRLQVRGEDQLFSYDSQLFLTDTHPMVGAGDWTFNLGTVPAGEVWILTHLYGHNATGVSPQVRLQVWKGANPLGLRRVPTLPQDESASWQGWQPCVEDDVISVEFIGVAGGDVLRASAGGFKMTLEM